MNIAYATTFDGKDVHNWSGTPYYMSQAFIQAGFEVDFIGSLERRLPPFFKAKQLWSQFSCQQRESPRFNLVAAKHYSAQVAKLLTPRISAIVAPQVNPIAFLDCKQPIFLWTDALYASLLGFYPSFANHSASTIRQGNIIISECLARTKLAIFSSDWAARTAIEIYGTDPEKIKVVPFGANFHCEHQLEDIQAMLKLRNPQVVKLLFIGKRWYRKGGDIVFNVAKALHAAGQSVELHFVGCHPPAGESIPPYIFCHGFISKRTPEGREKYRQLLREAHFLFVPSRAEAFGIVFCEANAYGLPCLTSQVGGITSVVKNHLNGMTFPLSATIHAYCDYILNLMQDYSQYESLALSSFNEYQTRLNWQSATAKVKSLIETTI